MEIGSGSLEFPLAYGLSFDYRYTKLNKHMVSSRELPMSVSIGGDFFLPQSATVNGVTPTDVTAPMYFHSN